jgi:hypothetical protein
MFVKCLTKSQDIFDLINKKLLVQIQPPAAKKKLSEVVVRPFNLWGHLLLAGGLKWKFIRLPMVG